MNLLKSRFCHFNVPEAWSPIENKGAIEERDIGASRMTLITEDWIDKPQTSEEYARKQVSSLQEENPKAEIVSEMPILTQQGLEGFLFQLRMPLSDGHLLRQHYLAVAQGPLVCNLVTTGSENDSGMWEEISPLITSSFGLHRKGWSSELTPITFKQETPSAELERWIFADAQISIPKRPGWTLNRQGNISSQHSQAVISINLSSHHESEVSEAFANHLSETIRNSNTKIESWNRGETDEGFDYYLVVGTVTEGEGKWNRGRQIQTIDAFVKVAGVIHLAMRSSEKVVVDEIGLMIHGVRRISEEEALVQISESWVELEIAGNWTPEAPGIYLRSTDSGIEHLILQKYEETGELQKLAEASIDSIKDNSEIKALQEDTITSGLWNGNEAIRYSQTYLNSDNREQHLRAAWIQNNRDIYLILTQGPDSGTTHERFVRCLESLKL